MVKRFVRFCLLFTTLNASLLSAAQVGWVVSDVVRIPRTDFPVTGPPPYDCLSPEESARLKADPVHRFHVFASRYLREMWDWVGRLQTYDNCARVCVVVPLGAEAILELRGFLRTLPDEGYRTGPWPTQGFYSRWDEAVDSATLTARGRLVCAEAHNWNENGVDAYFIVYFSY